MYILDTNVISELRKARKTDRLFIIDTIERRVVSSTLRTQYRRRSTEYHDE